MRRAALVLAALVLAACAADEPDGERLTHRFPTRPARILASAELPAACAPALVSAVLWYRQRGATLTTETVASTHPALLGQPFGGVIAILPGELGPRVLGETRLALTINGSVLAAEITLADCGERVVVHELGHALGLVHVDARDNLMHRALDEGGWLLTSAQLEWIADATISTAIGAASSGVAATWTHTIECEAAP